MKFFWNACYRIRNENLWVYISSIQKTVDWVYWKLQSLPKVKGKLLWDYNEEQLSARWRRGRGQMATATHWHEGLNIQFGTYRALPATSAKSYYHRILSCRQYQGCETSDHRLDWECSILGCRKALLPSPQPVTWNGRIPIFPSQRCLPHRAEVIQSLTFTHYMLSVNQKNQLLVQAFGKSLPKSSWLSSLLPRHSNFYSFLQVFKGYLVLLNTSAPFCATV